MGKVMFLKKGEVHTAPKKPGIAASDLAVGSIVKLLENGTPVDYLVVHKGLPSTAYDASCDGLWLLRKDIYANYRWSTEYEHNNYATSLIPAYLSNTFLKVLSADVQSAIKEVKIPYAYYNSYPGQTGNLTAKAFILSAREVGWLASWTSPGGDPLNYFAGTSSTAADSKRIAYLNGTASTWWLRSYHTSNNVNPLQANHGGACGGYYANENYGVRPALILPMTAVFDTETLLFKEVG